MKKNCLMYGTAFTTSYVFIHVLRELFEHHDEEVADYHFHLVFDDRRDYELARTLLSTDRVTLHAQYEAFNPFERNGSWREETVQRWESMYGSPDLRAYFANERMLQGRAEETKRAFLLSHIEYYEKLLEELRPCVYVSGPADALPSWVGLDVFKANGVTILSFMTSRFGRGSFAVDNPYEVLNVGDTHREMTNHGLSPEAREAAQELLTQYRETGAEPTYQVYPTSLRLYPRPHKVLARIKDAFFTDAKYYDLRLKTLAIEAFTARRTFLIDRYLRRKSVKAASQDQGYFFYPLQFEPEMALNSMAAGFTDQLELIRLITDALPADRWLYVKEHPLMLSGRRSVRFYRALLSLPGVRLVDQRVNSRTLIRDAEAVITINSTAGWEALMAGRPVLLFGRSFYEEFTEGVVRAGPLEQLPEVLRSLRDREVSEDSILTYIAAVLTRVKKGVIIEPRLHPWERETAMSGKNINDIASVILEGLEKGR